MDDLDEGDRLLNLASHIPGIGWYFGKQSNAELSFKKGEKRNEL